MYSFHIARVGRRKSTLEGLSGQERLWALCTPLGGFSGVSHAPRTQRACGAGHSTTGAPSVEPGGEEQKRRARLCFWGRAARALSPAPPPVSNGRPSPTALPPLGRAKWRPRHKMAAGPGHQRAMTENKKGAADPLPPAKPCWPELPFGGCRGQPSSDTGASSRPHGHTPGFPPTAPRVYHRRAVPLCGRCRCFSKSPLCRRRLRKGIKLERTERGTPAGPPLPAQDAPWVREGSAPSGSPHSQLCMSSKRRQERRDQRMLK